jgi:hypothetical protein
MGTCSVCEIRSAINSKNYDKILDTLYLTRNYKGEDKDSLTDFYKDLSVEENELLENTLKFRNENSRNLGSYLRGNKDKIKGVFKNTLDYVLKDSLYCEGQKDAHATKFFIYGAGIYGIMGLSFYLFLYRSFSGIVGDGTQANDPFLYFAHVFFFSAAFVFLFGTSGLLCAKNFYVKHKRKKKAKLVTDKLYERLLFQSKDHLSHMDKEDL